MNKQEIEKAIEVLRGIYPSQREIKTGEYDHVADALDDAISSLEHQLTNGWIPCKERLPEKNGHYLVCDADGLMGVVEFRNPWAEWFRKPNFDTAMDVIAWQPLPEPYKEVL